MKQTIIIRVLIVLILNFSLCTKSFSQSTDTETSVSGEKTQIGEVFQLDKNSLKGAKEVKENDKRVILLDQGKKEFKIINTTRSLEIQIKKESSERVTLPRGKSLTITVQDSLSIEIFNEKFICRVQKELKNFSLEKDVKFKGGVLKKENDSYQIELSSSQSLTITNKFSEPITVNDNQLEKEKKISLTNEQISSEITIEGIKIKVVVKQEPSEVKDSPIFLYHKDSWEEIKEGTTYVLDSLRLKYTNKNLEVYRIEANTKDANTKDKIKVEPKSIEEEENIIFDFSLKEGNLQYSIETEEKAIVFTVNCPPPGGPRKTGGGNNKDVPKSVFENKVTVFIGVLIITLLLLFFVYSIIIKKKRKQTALIQTKKESSFRSQNLMSEEVSEKQSDRSVIERNLLKKLLIGEVPNYLSSDYDELVRKIQLNNKKEENPRPRHIGIEETQLRREVEKLSREKSILNLNCDKYKEQVKNLQGQIGNLERRASESMALQAKLEKEISDLKPYNVAIGTFINSLDFAYKQLKQMEAEADKNSIFYPMIREIIDGQGRRISNPIFDVVRPYNTLMEVLKISSLDKLKDVSNEAFFNHYINNYCEKTLTQIAQLNAYACSSHPLSLDTTIERDNIDGIKSIYSNLSLAINGFGYRMILPQLGIDDFDSNKHVKSNNSTLMHLLSERIEAVPVGKIYDIARIGFETNYGQVVTKTTVVCKL